MSQMSLLGLITALLLPAVLGIAWLQLLWRESHLAAKIGYGYLIGIFTVTMLLRIWDGMGLSLNFIPISMLIILLSLPPLILRYSLKSSPTIQSHYTPFDATWQKVIWGLLLSILVFRYGVLLFEIIQRPLYPWDAWVNWAPKAKVWFEFKELIPFVLWEDWYAESIYSNAYTLNGPASNYPPTIPLIQTWTALGLGLWVDNTVNLPWVLCVIALGFSFYGQGRMLGAKPLSIMFMLFLLLSTPYINTHTALAGYAELWLGAFYGLAGMAFINWSQTHDYKQAVLCIIFAIACTQTKNPGAIWAILFIPASLFALLPKQWGYLVIGLTTTGLLLLFYLEGFSLHIDSIGEFVLTPEIIHLPGFGILPLTYHPVGHTFVENFLIRSSWHLLGWMALVLAIPLFSMAMRSYRLVATNILILLSILFLYFVFFFTSHYKAALDGTTINRAVFHLTPLLIFYLLFLMTLYMRKRDKAEATDQSTSTSLKNS